MFEKNTSQPAKPSREPREKDLPTTVISADTKIVGSIDTTQNLRVEGLIEGNITCAKLTVDAEGTINGDVLAESIVSNGTINGTVKTDMLRLNKTSRIDGGVVLKNWVVDSGAKVNATCHFTDHPIHHQDAPVDEKKAEKKSEKEDGDLKVVERTMDKKAKAS